MTTKKQIEYLQKNPVVFIEKVIGSQLWGKQQDIANAVAKSRRVAVRSCHGSGKTFLAARLALWWLFTRPYSAVLTTAPSNRQVVEVLWKELRVAYGKAKQALGGNLLPKAPKLQVDDDWVCIGFSTDNPVNFQGWHSRGGTLVIFDEAPGVHPAIWEAVGGVLVSKKDRHLCIGNPVEANGHFYEMFKKSDVEKIHISAFDTPNVTTKQDKIPGVCSWTWVEEKRASWGEDSPLWQSRVLGEFPTTQESTMVPLSWVHQANERWKMYEEEKAWESQSVHIGLDVARYGTDSTVMAEFSEELGIRKISMLKKQDTMQTVGDVIDRIKDMNVLSLQIDADGLGAGVYDRFCELLVDPSSSILVSSKSSSQSVYSFSTVKAIRGGMKASDSDRFLNRRAEYYWNIREKLDPASEKKIALPPDDELTSQLTSIRWRLDSRGKIRIETKDEMRTRGMQSPDKADAVVYAIAGGGTMSTFTFV